VAPEQLVASAPSTVVIMNPAYQSEIADTLRAMGIEAKLLVA
jgi:hypothetical protein